MLQDTRSKIIEQAYKLFISQGYKQTTTKNIAELAGVNETTIFNVFGSKGNLFHQSIAYYTGDIMRIDNEGLTFGKNLYQDFYLLLKKNTDLIKRTIPAFRLLVKGSLMDDTILHEINTKLQQLQNHFRQYLIGLQKRGLIKDTDFETMVEFLFGVIFHHSIILNIEESEQLDSEKSLEDFCSRYADYCLNLLRIDA